MNRYIYFFLIIFFLLLTNLHRPYHVFAQAQQLAIPSITPDWIKRQSYDVSKSLVLSKNKLSQTPKDTLVKTMLTYIPSVMGGGALIFGSVLTWINVQKKRKEFKKYMNLITVAEKEYDEAKTKNPKQKNLSSQLSEKLSKLLEEVDLAVINKKIDDDQRTTISHTIRRKLDEINGHA